MLKESILDNINPRNDIFQRFFRFALTNDKIIESFKRICKKYYLDEILLQLILIPIRLFLAFKDYGKR